MAIDFKIGEFREVIILQRQVTEKTATGAVLKSWKDYKTIYGKAELTATGESVKEGGRIVNISTYKISTYALPEVDSSFRAIWRGKEYEIVAVEPLRYVYCELTITG